MQRLLALAFAAALIAGSASAATPGGPYKIDPKGKCHAGNGQFVQTSLCKTPAAPQHCRDPKSGKYVKCGAPVAVPA